MFGYSTSYTSSAQTRIGFFTHKSPAGIKSRQNSESKRGDKNINKLVFVSISLPFAAFSDQSSTSLFVNTNKICFRLCLKTEIVETRLNTQCSALHLHTVYTPQGHVQVFLSCLTKKALTTKGLSRRKQNEIPYFTWLE